MNRYEIEPEYKILRYLQTQTENYNVTPKDIIENAGITSAYWNKDGVQMIADGIIGKKDLPEFGLTLTKDGHKRLDYFANLIHLENEEKAHRLRLQSENAMPKILPIAPAEKRAIPKWIGSILKWLIQHIVSILLLGTISGVLVYWILIKIGWVDVPPIFRVN